jgi:hypothetical protein
LISFTNANMQNVPNESIIKEESNTYYFLG